jgi:hypothetical protein
VRYVAHIHAKHCNLGGKLILSVVHLRQRLAANGFRFSRRSKTDKPAATRAGRRPKIKPDKRRKIEAKRMKRQLSAAAKP